ncbi:ParB/RepB/Spo0J family partition protein [Nocardioides lianchengensis]|uniref:ParB/RepB/Spo0J family partition protein n=1 Tax=Nocardioides lianchengensis TaxID=1045774 RepID=A0A1G6LR52_9ACTN|nr:ParB/RepB/Spo0J family partition protein [Nocardioides lianchengensis]NYG12484.1 ParB/RepB/Spo0J family partition protein [Nocardioides lianchengensis]SDC45186.1 ParB/RepB/Spo0J family partition protein [Nocardioides lianchengensis]
MTTTEHPTDTTVDLTTPTLPLDRVRQHPNNARWAAVADPEMVESIRSIGIAQALTVAPAYDWDGYYALGGNRRLDGAAKAGLDEVPVMLRDDLVTEAQQLEFMLVENLHRSDLSPAEEAAAYEQLTLFGHDIDAIAAATGRAKSTIKARLRLTSLGETARGRLHAGEITIADAEAVLEFAGDETAAERLDAALGTPDFQVEVRVLRRRRDTLASYAAQVEQWTAAGIALVEWPDGQRVTGPNRIYPVAWFTTDELRDPAGHDGCLVYEDGDADQHREPRLLCRDGSLHPLPATTSTAPVVSEQQRSQWEAQQAEREQRAARRAAASAARLDWMREHFAHLLPPRTHSDLAKAATAALPLLITAPGSEDAIDTRTLLAALGVAQDDQSYAGQQRARSIAAATVAVAKPTHALATFAAWTAASIASALDAVDDLSDDLTEIQHALAVWDWLKTAGYPLSEVDREVRTELEIRHTELVNETAEAAS